MIRNEDKDTHFHHYNVGSLSHDSQRIKIQGIQTEKEANSHYLQMI